MTPCPPEVPGNHAAMKAVDSLTMLSASKGLPENSTLTKGVFLSTLRTSSITFLSKLEKSSLSVRDCIPGA